MPKRGFRASPSGGPSSAGYPSLDQLSKRARRKLLAGVGAALISTGAGVGCFTNTGGDPALPEVSDAGTDAGPETVAPDANTVPGPDAGPADAGARPEDAEVLAGVPPLLDDGGW